MQSATVQDRLVDQFKLMQVYDVEYRFEARKELREERAHHCWQEGRLDHGRGR